MKLPKQSVGVLRAVSTIPIRSGIITQQFGRETCFCRSDGIEECCRSVGIRGEPDIMCREVGPCNPEPVCSDCFPVFTLKKSCRIRTGPREFTNVVVDCNTSLRDCSPCFYVLEAQRTCCTATSCRTEPCPPPTPVLTSSTRVRVTPTIPIPPPNIGIGRS